MPVVKFVKNVSSEKESFGFSALMMSVLGGYLCAMGLLVTSSWLFVVAGISQRYLTLTAKSILFVCAFLSGVFGGSKRKSNGYLFGGLAGAMYAGLLSLFSAICGTYEISVFGAVVTMILCALFGAAGGILGINCKSRKKSKKKYVKITKKT